MSVFADIGTEEDFRTLAENSPDIIDRFDRACRHTYVNAAGLRQLSLPAEKVIGKTVRETGVPEPFCTLWEERALQVFRTAEPLEVSDTFPGPAGLSYFNSRCVPEFGRTGEVQSVLVISRDITERKKMEDALRKLNEELEDRVGERTARLRKLALDMTRVEQKERVRIAELLHEDVQQQLLGVRLRLEQIRQSDGKSQLGEELGRVLDHLRTANEQIRHLTARLRPPILYDLGLEAALEWLADDMRSKFAFAVEIACSDLPQIRSDEINAFAFTAVSELLMNVVKHAGVKSACVDASVQGRVITLKVTDRGAGFDGLGSVKENTFGLFNIRERAETLGGRFELTGAPGQGTCAALTIPIE